jgi:hypothetical protein
LLEGGLDFRHGLCCDSWATSKAREVGMASDAAKRSLIEHFSALADPRQAWKVIYPLPEIMLLVLCATLAGAEDFVEARLWGCKHLASHGHFGVKFMSYGIMGVSFGGCSGSKV